MIFTLLGYKVNIFNHYQTANENIVYIDNLASTYRKEAFKYDLAY